MSLSIVNTKPTFSQDHTVCRAEKHTSNILGRTSPIFNCTTVLCCSRPWDSLTELTAQLRTFFQPFPWNVRISSTLPTGMSESPLPSSSKKPDSVSSPGLNLPYPSTQLSQMSGTSLFLEKLGVSSTQYSDYLILPPKSMSIIKSLFSASLIVAKSFYMGFKAIKDSFFESAST